MKLWLSFYSYEFFDMRLNDSIYRQKRKKILMKAAFKKLSILFFLNEVTERYIFNKCFPLISYSMKIFKAVKWKKKACSYPRSLPLVDASRLISVVLFVACCYSWMHSIRFACRALTKELNYISSILFRRF